MGVEQNVADLMDYTADECIDNERVGWTVLAKLLVWKTNSGFFGYVDSRDNEDLERKVVFGKVPNAGGGEGHQLAGQTVYADALRLSQ